MTLSSIGLPALNGFIGEFTMLVGAWQIPTGFHVNIPFTGKALLFSGQVWSVLAVLGIVLGAAYMLWLYQRTMFGKLDKPENQALKDLNTREVLTLAPLVALAFWIGLYPKPFLDILRPSVARIIQQMSENAPRSAGLDHGTHAGSLSVALPAQAAQPSSPEPVNE
jgi:NADH-quinone oxidoreductase subunit M